MDQVSVTGWNRRDPRQKAEHYAADLVPDPSYVVTSVGEGRVVWMPSAPFRKAFLDALVPDSTADEQDTSSQKPWTGARGTARIDSAEISNRLLTRFSTTLHATPNTSQISQSYRLHAGGSVKTVTITINTVPFERIFAASYSFSVSVSSRPRCPAQVAWDCTVV